MEEDILVRFVSLLRTIATTHGDVIKRFSSLLAPADDGRVAMAGVLVILARSIAFAIVEDGEILKRFAQAILLNEIHRPAAISILPECVGFDHLPRGEIITQLRVKIVPGGHDDETSGFHRSLERIDQLLKFTPPHTADDENTIDDIIGVGGIAIVKCIAPADGDR